MVDVTQEVGFTQEVADRGMSWPTARWPLAGRGEWRHGGAKCTTAKCTTAKCTTANVDPALAADRNP
jgi:hypothetical protein